jgi:LysW-gamma-L-alpha-aminoadipyl-6-phosphate/LysW-L-glutamyl-5-phosphate reductase
MKSEKQKAIIWGGGGFVGRELARLLACHPDFELTAVLSATHVGRPVGEVYPSLAAWTDLDFVSPEGWLWEQVKEGSWTLFMALPHGKAMQCVPEIVEKAHGADLKVVDLSGDFRLRSVDTFEKYYGEEHVAPEYLDRFVYGLPELNHREIAAARFVAGAGCFATCAQLAILPVAAMARGVRNLAVDSKTGSSGAGAAPGPATHHPVRANNFSAYGQFTHRHFAEIDAGWVAAGGAAGTDITFVPQRAPMVRGIFTTAHIFLDEAVSQDAVSLWYRAFYADAPFVRLVDGSPTVATVFGTNRCDISVAASGRTVVVCAAIDNLVKGAAGQAIQCANLACGFDETAGLLYPAPAPV